MAGYGYRGSGQIIQAVSDYHNYKENKRRYDQDRRDRLNRQFRAEERQARIDEMNAEKHQAYMDEIADGKQRRLAQDEARRGFNDYNIAEIDREHLAEREAAKVAPMTSEQAQQDGQWLANKVMSYGASGKGVRIQYDEDPNEPGVYLAKNVDADGNTKQLTWDPFDDSSAPIRIREQDREQLEQHIAGALQGTENLPTEAQAAYGRSAIAPNDDGTARPARTDEFESSIIGTLKNFSDGISEFGEGVGKVFSGGGGKFLAGKVGEHAVGAAEGLAAPVVGLAEGLKHWWSGASDEAKATVDVKEDGTPKIKPSKLYDVEAVKKAKAEIDASGVDLGIERDPNVNPLVYKSRTVEALREIDERYASKRRKAEAVGELYLTGAMDEEAYTNYMASGDPNTSQMDLDKFAEQTRLNSLNVSQRNANYLLQVSKLRAAQAKGDADAAAKLRKEVDKTARLMAEDAAAVAFPNMKTSQRKAVVASGVQALNKLFATSGMDESEILNRFGGVTIQDAMISYARNVSDFQTESIAPYLVASMNGVTAHSDEGKKFMNTLGSLSAYGWTETQTLDVSHRLAQLGLGKDKVVEFLQTMALNESPPEVVLREIEAREKGKPENGS